MKRLLFFIFISVIVNLSVISPATAATIYIPEDLPEIQMAMGVVTDGDSILVGPGIYNENIDFLGKNIILASLFGADSTTIAAADSDLPVVTIASGESREAILWGFTITGGNSGIYCKNSSPAIIRNVITANHAQVDGGGFLMENTTGAFIGHNIIFGNEADQYGAAIQIYNGQDDTLCYNISYNNIGFTEFRCIETDAVFYNNTIFPSAFHGISNSFGGLLRVKNNIIVGAPHYAVHASDASLADVSFNCLWESGYGGYGGDGCVIADTGTIVTDPLFVDRENHDFHLSTESPCIDAGDPDPFFNDLDSTGSDMGACPFNFPLMPLVTYINIAPMLDSIFISSSTPDFSWDHIDTLPRPQAMFQVQVCENEDWETSLMWDTRPVISSQTNITYAGASLVDYSTYNARVRVNNGIDWSGWLGLTFCPKAGKVIRIPDMRPTIQLGIDCAMDGDTILVSPGIYRENVDFRDRCLVLTSTDGPESTIIEANDTGKVVRIASGQRSNTVLSGFTIRGGKRGGIFCYDSSPLIENNIICNNIGSVSYTHLRAHET